MKKEILTLARGAGPAAEASSEAAAEAGNLLDSERKFSTLAELLQARAQAHPHRLAYTFLEDGAHESARISYRQLDLAARAIAAVLQARKLAGERILVLCPPGPEFVKAFLGCQYAGAVPVPAAPPRSNRLDERLEAIAADARLAAILSTAAVQERRQARGGILASLPWIQAESLLAEYTAQGQSPVQYKDAGPGPAGFGLVEPGEGALAFLQYTSGSTATPKGVAITHRNLLAGEELLRRAMGHSGPLTVVSWLPPYHDMGLIGDLLQCLYVGGHSIQMPPIAFLKRPLCWLLAISRYRGQTCGAPNFAYDLCAREIPVEERACLDLSCWRVAYSGAEPVRFETLQRFTKAFAPCGFRWEAFYPCYGLAEATLMATGATAEGGPDALRLSKKALEKNRAVPAREGAEASVTLVSCGRTWLEGRLEIVEPSSGRGCSPGQIGEVWIAGPHVASGYWNRPQETKETFHARLDTGEGPFLRTGDLGFFWEGELFVTGRKKDLIIVRGRNHYPQDLEGTAERSHEALCPGSGAAFSVEEGGEERVVVVQEVRRQHRKANLEGAIRAIRAAVCQEHGLRPWAVVLVQPASIPKTTSGKIQRRACRKLFLEGRLKVLAESRQEAPAGRIGASSEASAARPTFIVMEAVIPSRPVEPPSAAQIESWLAGRLCAMLGLAPEEIEARAPLASYGLDSLRMVDLVGELGAWLGRPIPETLAWQYPTIETLAGHLAGRAACALHETGGYGLPREDRPRCDEEVGEVLNDVERLSAQFAAE